MEKVYNFLRSWYLEETERRKNLESEGTEEKTYKVYETKGQLRITIPKVLATAVGLDKGSRSCGR